MGVEEIEMALCTIVQGVTGQLPHNLTCDLIKQGRATAPTFAAFFPALVDQLPTSRKVILSSCRFSQNRGKERHFFLVILEGFHRRLTLIMIKPCSYEVRVSGNLDYSKAGGEERSEI